MEERFANKFNTASDYDGGVYLNVQECLKFITSELAREKEEAIKQVRYGNLGRCPRHDESLRCPKCLKELSED